MNGIHCPENDTWLKMVNDRKEARSCFSYCLQKSVLKDTAPHIVHLNPVQFENWSFTQKRNRVNERHYDESKC